MSFNVKTLSVFERQAKRLVKKFPSLKKELQTLISELKEEPEKGTPIGHNCYKIRLAIASKGKGKSGGARVVTHVVFKEGTVYLLSIYDKSDIENLADNEVLELVKMIP
ncbi:MAG TPA: type II toxin-antitoxin system RelE/ParE family toxin [Prolixibacteraceae bacterium]|nr:type II toxin-antitoxin system RelE/ParE family toxin [Prolixibacteraceae bacterium]